MYISTSPLSSTPTPTVTATSTLTATPTVTVTYTPIPTDTAVPGPTATPGNGYNYDRDAAIAYADQWAHEPRNTNYPLSNETGCGCNDCTNYASQVLNNGGYPIRSGNWDENSHFEWWYRDGGLFQPDNSKTWSATDWMNSYFAQYPNEFDVVPSKSSLERGDFILMDLRDNKTGELVPDGKPDHVRVVVGYGSTSVSQEDYTKYTVSCEKVNLSVPQITNNLLVNQHCVDRWHVAWDYAIDFEIDNLWYIHVIE